MYQLHFLHAETNVNQLNHAHNLQKCAISMHGNYQSPNQIASEQESYIVLSQIKKPMSIAMMNKLHSLRNLTLYKYLTLPLLSQLDNFVF